MMMGTMTAASTTEPEKAGTGHREVGLLRSARTRLVAAVLILLAFSTAASVLALRELLIARVGDRVDDSLDQEAREFRRLVDAGRDPRTGEPFGNDIASMFEVFLARNVPFEGESYFTFVEGQPYRSSVTDELDQELEERLAELGGTQSTLRDEIETDAAGVRILAVPVEIGGRVRGVFAVTVDLASERAEVDEAVRFAAGVGIAAFLLGSLLAIAISGRVLAPVRELTETARAISETDFTRRIEVRGSDELAELARTFNAMLDRLEEAFATQRSFLSDAGHELRTPITIVRGHLEVMGDDPEERRETLELVTDELDRMGRLVDDLLLLARARRPDFLRPEAVALEELSAEVLAKAEALAPRDWRLASAGGGTLSADRQRLTQALINLAQNAASHTVEGEAIELGAEIRNGEALLWVEDHGPGIPADEQERVFERFYRSDGTRAEGSGLGLSIVRAIAEAHGGRVEVDSAPGRGSRFTVVIPTRAPGAAERGLAGKEWG
jgi:two-component system OmpR family sensor kinase